MMIMARWNDMSWFVGPKEVRFLEGLSTSFAMKTDTSSDKDGKTPTETVGMNEIEVSCSTTYRIETGTRDIKAVIEQWKTLIGKAAPLFIGSKVFGAEMMQLQSVSISDVAVRPQGYITAATLSFKFKEFKEKVKASTVQNTAGGTTSAVTVTASTEDKKNKKTYDDIKAEQTRDR